MNEKLRLEASPKQLIICGIILIVLGNASFEPGSTVKLIFTFLALLGVILFFIGIARLLFERKH
jgi:uncharacterized membrane protein YobD (UPF0266 family)